ncbi:MAG TPA: Nramp family divalent metal transporter [Gaiellaceae bacterium]|jgi:manganese transport protein|nr:Nramp family divalent metal transporter [Gaiellaceae bacterium]
MTSDIAVQEPLPAGLRTVDEALHRTRFRILPFLGPAFIACIAYIDPGNFATNIAAGSRFGYTLIWVIVASNMMAMVIQTLSAKLGIATGHNLAELCRQQFSRRTAILLWLQAEAIAMATDLAEFLGAAIGFSLLLGTSLFVSTVLTGIAAFAILQLQSYGLRPFEALIAALVGLIGLCYLAEIFYSHPDLHAVARHAVVPEFHGSESVLLAVGIIGATVMPHVIYLHSALTQDRIVPESAEGARVLMRYTRIDVLAAMTLAGLINVAMLVMAASTFARGGLAHVESLVTAHRTLEPILGQTASALFAIALLGSGLSSSAVGTLAGQVVMQGFVERQIPVWTRRLVTMIPAFVVVGIGVDPTRTLVISQVVLSFGIPFALIPLVRFTSQREIMGPLVNRSRTTAAAVVIATLIVSLNLFLLWETFLG